MDKVQQTVAILHFLLLQQLLLVVVMVVLMVNLQRHLAALAVAVVIHTQLVALELQDKDSRAVMHRHLVRPLTGAVEAAGLAR
jgi:hypothetical protein